MSWHQSILTTQNCWRFSAGSGSRLTTPARPPGCGPRPRPSCEEAPQKCGRPQPSYADRRWSFEPKAPSSEKLQASGVEPRTNNECSPISATALRTSVTWTPISARSPPISGTESRTSATGMPTSARSPPMCATGSRTSATDERRRTHAGSAPTDAWTRCLRQRRVSSSPAIQHRPAATVDTWSSVDQALAAMFDNRPQPGAAMARRGAPRSPGAHHVHMPMQSGGQR